MGLHVGDRVRWRTSQGSTSGEIVERREHDFTFDGQHFTASRAEPAFLVKSAKTGAMAAHKESALRADDS